MNVADFATRLERHLVLDHCSRPLQLTSVGTEAGSRYDTFMACLSYRLHESNTLEKRTRLRSTLLLQFCAIVFQQRWDSITHFLRDKNKLEVFDKAYRHPAVQYWCQKLHARSPHLPRDASTLISDFPTEAKEEAIRFVHKNKEAGHCTCRYTMCALFASHYRCTVYLYERDNSEPIVIKPPERNLAHLSLDAVRKKRNNKEYFVYIWYDGKAFHLLLPVRKQNLEMNRWFRQGASTSHVQPQDRDVQYELTRSRQGEVHHITYFAPPSERDELVHVAVLSWNEEWRLLRDQFYMVLPPRGSGNMHLPVPEGKQIFIYCCDAENKVANLVGHVEHYREKAIFQLAEDVVLVFALAAANQQEADRALEEEMKIKVK